MGHLLSVLTVVTGTSVLARVCDIAFAIDTVLLTLSGETRRPPPVSVSVTSWRKIGRLMPMSG